MGGHFPPAGTAVPLGGAMPGPPSGVASGVNPLDALSSIPGAQPLSRVNLLVSLPMLVIGLSNYVLVPATAAFGRRAVMIFCGVLSTACTLWAGFSTSLESHLAARCLQGLGAGCVETVIRLIIQDITFLHQRSSYLGTIWAFQVRLLRPIVPGRLGLMCERRRASSRSLSALVLRTSWPTWAGDGSTSFSPSSQRSAC